MSLESKPMMAPAYFTCALTVLPLILTLTKSPMVKTEEELIFGLGLIIGLALALIPALTAPPDFGVAVVDTVFDVGVLVMTDVLFILSLLPQHL